MISPGLSSATPVCDCSFAIDVLWTTGTDRVKTSALETVVERDQLLASASILYADSQ